MAENIYKVPCADIFARGGSDGTVRFGDMLAFDTERAQNTLFFPVGMTEMGEAVFYDLKKTPNLMICGQTCSGKSVFINSMLAYMLMSKAPEELSLVLIDPKRVELDTFGGIPHLARPIVTDPKEAAAVLRDLMAEIDRRYELLTEKKVRNIDEYNALDGVSRLPYTVLVISELADLMLFVREDVEAQINYVAAKGRAAGVHVVISTQRPSVDVLTGLVKANIPSKVAFKVPRKIDSRVILGSYEAADLTRRGELIFSPNGYGLVKAQGAFISEDELAKLCERL
jgi:S-DNA-T family DNA segregation ATPase FtsK/SpoIIIE